MISVCIATHNGEKYIKEQLDSILCQLGPEDEVIVSDDGSTDCTIHIILSLNDQRIKLYQINHKNNDKRPHWYVTKNFENAIRHANGDYIFLSDQDDVWYENKVSICLREIGNNIALMHNLECVDSKLDSLNRSWFDKPFLRKNYFQLFRSTHMGCALMFKNELKNILLPFPNELLVHDFWIGILAELNGGLKYIDMPLVKYRIHNLNTSGSAQFHNSFSNKILYRLYTLICLLLRMT